jgi:hypothetical protein
MDADTTFLDCPAYINRSGSARCGLPAVVEDRYPLDSTDGPVTGVRIRCPKGHWFNGPVDALTVPPPVQSLPRTPSRANILS